MAQQTKVGRCRLRTCYHACCWGPGRTQTFDGLVGCFPGLEIFNVALAELLEQLDPLRIVRLLLCDDLRI